MGSSLEYGKLACRKVSMWLEDWVSWRKLSGQDRLIQAVFVAVPGGRGEKQEDTDAVCMRRWCTFALIKFIVISYDWDLSSSLHCKLSHLSKEGTVSHLS